MALLKPGRPVITREPTLLVENDLASGRYRFRLRVFDEEGNASNADELEVVVGRFVNPVTDPDLNDGLRRVRESRLRRFPG